MLNQRIGRLLGLALTGGLAACSGGGGGDDHPFGSAWCEAIGGEVTVIPDPACGNCSVTHPDNAADGALGSFATLSTNQIASGAGIAVRATSVEHPGGTLAAVFFRLPSGAQAWTLTAQTYLGGVQQESSPPYSTPSTGTSGEIYGTLVIQADNPFDAIEIRVSAANYNSMPFDFRIYEFCSDAGSPYMQPEN